MSLEQGTTEYAVSVERGVGGWRLSFTGDAATRDGLDTLSTTVPFDVAETRFAKATFRRVAETLIRTRTVPSGESWTVNVTVSERKEGEETVSAVLVEAGQAITAIGWCQGVFAGDPVLVEACRQWCVRGEAVRVGLHHAEWWIADSLTAQGATAAMLGANPRLLIVDAPQEVSTRLHSLYG